MPGVRRAALGEILTLRQEVLRPGLPMSEAAFDGDDDPTTRHYGSFDPRGACVGCVSLMRRPWNDRPAWQLRGMAIRTDRQRTGLGSVLLHHVEHDLARETSGDPVWCNARIAAVPFYERHGWLVDSHVFDLPGVGPHRRMVRPAT